MSYTSRQEFDLEKRVHFTNEIPPYDMFDGLNSVLQTSYKNGVRRESLWKWVLGYSRVAFDMPYCIPELNEATNKVSYKRDIDSGEVFYKMVNGEYSKVYGPVGTESSSDNTRYHQIEEYGVLLPEFDYLLHEVYRYLENLYPDHPDYMYLLTDNEFNDAINAAGAIIDYKSDNAFYDKLASSLGLSDAKDEDGISDVDIESAMIKIRNLKNEAYRRKLFGSKMGYRMFASDIYQCATVFPVATYLPIKPIDKEILSSQFGKDSPFNNAEELKDWNDEHDTEFSKEEYRDYIRKNNRIIDTYSKYYYKKFRLIDLDGSNSSYPAPEDTSSYIFGHGLPFNEYSIIEYPASADIYSHVSNVNVSDIYENTDINIGTSYIVSKNADRSAYKLSWDSVNKETNVETSISFEVHSAETSIKNPVPYVKLYSYPSIRTIEPNESQTSAIRAVSYFTSYRKDTNNSHLPTTYTSINFMQDFFVNFNGKGYKDEDIDNLVKEEYFITNTFAPDTLFVRPSVSLSFYPDTVRGVKPQVQGSDIYYMAETETLWNVDAIQKGRLLAIEKHSPINTVSKITALSEITNFTKGKIEMTASGISTSESIVLEQDDRYGFVVENEEGNLVVFEGSLVKEEYYSGGRYYINKEILSVSAIPDRKSEALMMYLYPDYFSLTRSLADFETKISEGVHNGFNRELAERYLSKDNQVSMEAKEEILSLPEDYTDFISYVSAVMQIKETLESYAINRGYIYRDSSYIDKDGIEHPYEETLIYPNCKVINVFSINAIHEDINSEDNLGYSTITYLGNGTISYIDLGCLNTLSIYDSSNGYVKVGEHTHISEKKLGVKIESTEKLDEDGNPVLDDDGNPVMEEKVVDEGFTYYYIESDSQISDHKSITLPFWENGLPTTKEYKQSNEYSYSELSEDLANYCANNYDGSRTNIKCSPLDRTLIKIESVINVGNENTKNVISFESDVARELFKSLSVGDVVTGPSIDSDDNNVFITSIGDNQVTVNVNLQQSGTFVLNYAVKMLTAQIDITDNVNTYKSDLYNNGLYAVANPFEHGLWPSADFPYVSRAVLDSLPDVTFYKFPNYQIDGSKDSITILMENCYDDVKKENETFVPSDIKFNNEIFYELNINKLLQYRGRDGVSPILMGVEWLDYLQNNLKDTSRATDNVNVGVNLMMETDTSGYYTLIQGQSYTDPGINLKFITMNIDGNTMWPEANMASDNWTVPVYAQIGTGGQGRRKWFTSPDDISYPSVYGVATFDNIKNSKDYDTESEFYRQGGELRKASVWGNDPNFSGALTSSTDYNSVEKPLFEIPLGEYDTVIKYAPNENNSSNVLSVTQVSFYSQTFSNLLKYFTEDEDVLKVNGKDISSPKFLNQLIGDEFYYAGTWNPEKTYDADNDIYEINYPSNPEDKSYYIVEIDTTLTNIGKNRDTFDFNCTDVLFYYGGKFELRSFKYMGAVGNRLNKYNEDNSIKYIVPDTNLAPGKFEITDGEIKKERTFTLIDRLLQYYLRASGYYNAIQVTNIINNLNLKDNNETTDIKNLCDAIKAVKNTKTNYILDTHMPYYVFVGGNEDLNNIPSDAKIETSQYQDGNDISIGDRIALVKLGDDSDPLFLLFKINTETIMGATLPVESFGSMTEDEVFIINGNNKDVVQEGYDFGTLVDSFNSRFDLPRKYLTPGSLSFNFIVDPHFISQGYEYEDDNETLIIDDRKIVEFCSTKGSVYYDSKNDAFYCFSNVYNPKTKKFDEETKKIAIKFNEQKFFKNVMNITGIYQIQNTLDEGSTEYTKNAVFKGIDGIDFDLSKIASNDRILKIKSTELRSVYNRVLEPAYFSNYTDINFTIRGITEDNELYLSFIPEGGSTIERMNFATDAKALLPVNITYDDASGLYSAEPISDETITFGEKYDNPEVKDIDVTMSFISNSVVANPEEAENAVNRNFIFFKNNLIFKASVDMTNPRTIVASSSNLASFTSSLEKINIGDKLVGGVALTDTGLDNLHTVSIYKILDDSSAEPERVIDFNIVDLKIANGRFIAVNSEGECYYNDDVNVEAITDRIECRYLLLKDQNNDVLTGITGVSYNFETNEWCIERKIYPEGTTSGAENDSNDLDLSSNKSSEFLSFSTSAGVVSPMFASSKNILIDIGDEEKNAVLGHATGDINKDYIYDSRNWSYEQGEQWYQKLNDSAVVLGADESLEEVQNGRVDTVGKNMFYKDISLSYGMLTLDAELTEKASEDDGTINNYVFSMKDYSASPYITSTLRTNSFSSSMALSSALMSRTLFESNRSGNYSVYAKGRDLFIKSPTALASYNELTKKYEYSGELSTSSYWKIAKAPVLSENTYTYIRSNAAGNPDKVYELLTNAAINAYAFLNDGINLDRNENGNIKVDGLAITSSKKSELDDINKIITDITGCERYTEDASGYRTYPCKNIMNIEDFRNIKSIKSEAFKDVTKTHDGNGKYNNIKARYNAGDKRWEVKLTGFRIIEDTVKDANLNVIGSDFRQLAEFGENYETFIYIDDGDTIDFEGGYARYAYYLDYFVFGDLQESSLVMSSNIRKAAFNNSKLFIIDNYNNVSSIALNNLNKREDIENADNWSTSVYPDDLVYMTEDEALASTSYIKYNGHIYYIPRLTPRFLRSIFNVTTTYINDEVILLGGYIPSKNTIDTLYRASRGDIWGESDDEYLNNLKANSMKENFTCPAVFYSLNGGANFQKIELPEMSENGSKNLRITSIKYIEGEFHFIAKATNSSASLSQFYYIESDSRNIFDFSKAYLTDMTSVEDTLGSANQTDTEAGVSGAENATALNNTSSSANASPVESIHLYVTPGKPDFSISTRKGVSCGDDVVVTAKTAGSITVSKPLFERGEASVDVLLSFNTRENIDNQATYMNVIDINEFFTIYGKLKVPETTVVQDKAHANRMYSYRELLPAENRDPMSDTYDMLGYPACVEDTEHVYYKYETKVSASTGEEVYTPVAMLNDYNSEIKLCDVSGSLYLLNTTDERVDLYNLYNRISLEDSFFKPAMEPIFTTLEEAEANSNFRNNDDTFTSYVGKEALITQLCVSNDSPYIKVKSLNRDFKSDVALDSYIFCEDDIEEFADFLNYTTREILNFDTETVVKAVEGITFVDGEKGEQQKYIRKEIDGTNYWYDNQLHIFPLRSKRYLTAKALLKYAFSEGLNAYRNLKFSDITEGSNLIEKPITGIYLSNYGYGGSRNNMDLWKDTLPWINDPSSFGQDYIKNKRGEYIYLVDENGNRLKSNVGEIPTTTGTEISINRSSIDETGHKTISIFDENGHTYNMETVVLEKSHPTEYLPFNRLKLYSSETGEGKFEITFFIIKNGRIISTDPSLTGEMPKVESIGIKYIGLDENFKEITEDCKDFEIDSENNILRFNGIVSKENIQTIKSLEIEYVYHGVSYKKNLDVEELRVINDSIRPTHSVLVDRPILFRKNGNKYNYVSYDIPNNRPFSNDENRESFADRCVISFPSDTDVVKSLGNTDSYSADSSSIYFTPTINNGRAFTDKMYLSINQYNSIDDIECPSLKISDDKNPDIYEFVNPPVFDVGEYKVYFYNRITSEGGKFVKNIEVDGYFGDEKVDIDYKPLEGYPNIFEVKYGDYLIGEFTVEDDRVSTSIDPSLEYFISPKDGKVFYYGVDSLKFDLIWLKPTESGKEKDIFIQGTSGDVICRMPVYDSFYELINKKGYVIGSDSEMFDYHISKKAISDIKGTNEELNAIEFTQPFGFEDLDDGQPHVITLKIMTQASISPSITDVNDPDTFEEVSLSEINDFTPDRVWFNPDGFPTPPIEIGNYIFNSENNSEYYEESYRNNNNFDIYRCNKDGYLVGYTVGSTIDRSSQAESLIKDKNGNVTAVAKEFILNPAYHTLDNAQIPRRPMYSSCQSWFENEFYLKGNESNPYWQVISIRNRFNNNKKSWEQYAKVNEYVRASQSMVLQEVSDEDKYISITNATRYDINDTGITITRNSEFVDVESGEIRFLLTKPASKYKTEKQFVKYGITATNPFYNDGEDMGNLGMVWNEQDINLAGYISSNYTVNSTENLADPNDHDSEIQSVTELGLFNAEHKLIAYAVFPPIEYRTNSQHISFTCYVKMGALTDPRELELDSSGNIVSYEA